MPLYRIDYTDDDGDHSVEIEELNDEEVDGRAYDMTDKGPYKVYRKVIGPKYGQERWEKAFDCYTSTNRKFTLVGGFYVKRKR